MADKEVEKLVEFLKSQGEVTYSDEIMEQIENSDKTDKEYECNSVFDGRSGLLLIWNEADE